MKLLLHTCCAPCSVYCIDSLRSEGIEPTVYWFNPNIHPYMEYKARRDTLKEYTQTIGEEVETVEDVYEPYLMQIGFLSRTPRGRIALEPAYKHMGIEFNN